MKIWQKVRRPGRHVEPTYQSITRCGSCGHESIDHEEGVGCLVEGGSKYISDGNVTKGVCACETFLPVQIKS